MLEGRDDCGLRTAYLLGNSIIAGYCSAEIASDGIVERAYLGIALHSFPLYWCDEL